MQASFVTAAIVIVSILYQLQVYVQMCYANFD